MSTSQSLTAAERVIELLRTFNEARVSYGAGSTGQGVRLMPSMWHEGSYAELELRLIDLRESSRRPLWWHVSARYRWGVERTIVLPVIRRRAGAEFSIPRGSNFEVVAGGPSVGTKAAVARIYRWDEGVDDTKAAEGVSVLTGSMYEGRKDRICLPLPVLQRRMGLPIAPERELIAA